MSNKIKAVIFDMDGVLIDAKDWHYEALNQALSLFGSEISRYDHLVTFDGLPTKEKLKMLSMEKNFPKGLHDFINRMKQEFTVQIVFAKCKPVFHHQYALSKLKAEGYKMCVCSNSVKNSINLMMEKSGLLNFLEFIVSNQDVKNAKPDPEMYQVAIEKLGLMPHECLIVEDNENGIKAGIASGAHVLKVDRTQDVNYVNLKQKIKELESA